MRSSIRVNGRIFLAVASLWLVSSDWSVAQSPPSSREVLDRYCVTCHTQRAKEPPGGLTFDTLDPAKVSESPEIWEKVVRKLHAGTMPPPPARRPDHATY